MSIRSRIENGFERFARGILRFRWIAILVLLAITFAMGSLVPQVRTDNSQESFLKPSDPARVAYDRFKEQFGGDDLIHVLFLSDEVFSPDFFELLRSIHEEIEREAPYVTDVTSLINARNTRGEGDSLVVEDLTENFPRTPEDFALLKERVFSNPLFVNALISESGRLTAIAVRPFAFSTLTPELDTLEGFDGGDGGGEDGGEDAIALSLSAEEAAELVGVVQEIVARHARPSDEIYVTGGPVINTRMNRIMGEDIAGSFSLTILLIFAILLLLFRRLSGALLPLLVVVGSVIATLGAMVLLDIPFSMTLNVLPAMLLTVGICDSIHILAIVFLRLGDGDTRDESIVHALKHSGLAVLMTSVTTAAGLGSFVTAKLAGVSHLGFIAPIGVLFAMVYSLVLLPALLSVLPIKAKKHRRGWLESFATERLLFRLGRVATDRPLAVVLVSGALVLISMVGVSRVQFSHDGIRWFPEDDPVRYSAELVDREFKGTSSLEVLVDTGRENGMHEPATLARIEAAMRWSETLSVAGYDVSKAISLVDVVKEINRALNEDRASAYRVPEDRELIAQELLLFENSGTDDLEDVTDSLFQLGRITIRTPWVDAMEYPPFVARIESELPDILGPDLPFELTGGASIFSALFRAVILSMAESYVIALSVITPLLILLMGNVRRGLLAMIPNLLPIIFTIALMGWLGIPLDASTLLIGGVVIGVAVDDTIHFMHKFNTYYAEHGDPKRAVHETLETTGTALLFTSLVLCAGFAVFTTTYLVNTMWFGLLASFATAIAFLADVLVAPALMVLASGKPRDTEAADSADSA